MKRIRVPGLHRGMAIAAANDPTNKDIAATIGDIHQGIEKFKAKYDKRVDDIAAAVEEANSGLKDVAQQVAAARVSPVGCTGVVSARDRAEFNAAIRSSMTTQSDPDGGYMVPATIDGEIAHLARDLSPMRRLARIVTVSQGQYSKLISQNGSEAEWHGETTVPTETQGLKLAQMSPAEGQLTAMPKVSQWLLDDSSFDVAGELSRDIAEAFAEKESAAFVNGNGVGRPRGFLTHDTVANASWSWGKLGFIKSGNATDFTADPDGADALVDLVYSLKASYRQNASWIMSSATAGEVRKMKNENGDGVWADSIAAGQPPRLLGYPVELDENMPAVGANAFPIAFGDFQRGYLILDRLGTRVLRDPYSSKPFVVFFTTKRVGGGVLDFNAIKLLKIAA